MGRRSAAGLVTVLLVWGVLGAIAWVPPATACTCAPLTIADVARQGGTGFVGTLVDRGPQLEAPIGGAEWATTPHRFSVERWLLGGPDGADGSASLPAEPGTEEIVFSSVNGGGDCGLDIEVGEPVAILAYPRSGRLIGGLCGTLPPAVALAEVDAPASAAGVAHLAVVGHFAGSLIAYFDIDGRFLGYEGDVEIESEPGSETGQLPSSWQPGTTACLDGEHVVVQQGTVFRTIAVTTGRDVVEPMTLDEDLGVQAMRCTEPGQLLAVEYATTLQLRDVTTGEVQALTGRPRGPAVLTGAGVAMIRSLDPGEQLVLVGSDGQEEELARIDRTSEDDYRGFASLDHSPAAGELALLEVDYRGGGFDAVRSTIRIIDVASGEERIARTLAGETWGAHWVDETTLGITFGSDDVDRIELIDATTLTSIGSVPGWTPHRSTLIDGVLWGVADGVLHRAELGQRPETVFGFPARSWAPVLPVAAPFERPGDASGAQAPGSADAPDPDDPATSTTVGPATATGQGPTAAAGDEAEETAAAIGDGDGNGDRGGPDDGGRSTGLAVVAIGAGLGIAAAVALVARGRRSKGATRLPA